MDGREIRKKYISTLKLSLNSTKFPHIIKDCDIEIRRLQKICNHKSDSTMILNGVNTKICNYCSKIL